MATESSMLAQQPPLPSGDAVDILPALHELLSRIEHQTTTDASNAGIAAVGNEDELTYAELTPLEPRELPTEVLAIKTKIRRALKEIEKLPDMDRSVDQQEQEIQELETRVQKQREMLEQMSIQAQSLFG